MLEFDAKKGLISVTTPFFSCAEGYAGISISGAGVTALRGSWRRSANGFRRSSGDLTACLSIRTVSAREAHLELAVSTTAAEGMRVESLMGLVLPAAASEWSADPDAALHYVHNVSLADPHGVKLLTRSAPWVPPFAKSEAVTVLYDPSRRGALLIGVLPGASSSTVVEPSPATSEGKGGVGFTVSCDIRATLLPGRTFTTGPILLLAGDDPHGLLEEYGKRWAKAVQPALKSVRVGWNSWDYYSGSVRRQDADENLDAGRKAFGGKVKTWVIDEGWESQWGVWRPNWKWPQGMADYCKRVRDAGGEPGIWTAPLCMNIYSPHSRYTQDWFLCNAKNQPIMDIMAYGYIAFLDPTRDEVCQWLGDTFSRLREDGFTYYKLDFLDLIFKAHHFHDPTVPRAQALRRAVQTIRDAVGRDAYVLCCPPHMEAVAGIVDAVRIAGDIHNFWGHIKQNALSAGIHYWKHRRLWNNDGDFAIVRCAELSDDPFLNRPYERRPLAGTDYWFAGPEANLEECRTWLSICYLGAGDMILGDALPKLSPKGLDMLRRVLDRLPNAARPLDLFSDNSPASRWRAKTEEGWLMGYFNWDDFPKDIQVDPSDWGGRTAMLKDFWTDRRIPVRQPVLHLPPHHSRLLRIIGG